MKIVVSALIAIAVLIPVGMADAQGGCYRHPVAYLSATMNIRQSSSTDSQIVRKAQAGESFTVSSSTHSAPYCWLNISHGWMAWTSRVSGSAPTGAAPPLGQATQPSNIDNCCFVNRQCHTDSDWLEGYWAYQRNECPVGAPTSDQSIVRPVTRTADSVDNCCFIGWHCDSEADWVRGCPA